MLQRAASNAYSWWWASHIRTKQSKWLEQNLQDMEEKMQAMLKLIQEDGDSFAKRAEMYYKRRPELINFVEETYRAYRALADRYDHISTELQNANNTIAYVFPEQAQFAMEDDEDEAAPNKLPKKPQEAAKGNVPKVPKLPKEVKGFISSATKKLQSKKAGKGATTTSAKVVKSGFSKPEGIKEIDKLQKQILALQTQKEFAKSSYEGNLSKYWEIEERITGMQERVFTLEDEFGAGPVIEDNDARNLMASAALKSCEEVLTKLEEKQERNAEKAVVEHERITDAREKLDSLKDELLQGQTDQDKPPANDDRIKAGEKRQSLDQEVSSDTKETQELELLRDKVKVHFDVGVGSSLTALELAEKVDELVNKVISLETAVSSQSAVMQRLRTDTDELQAEIRTLEDDKATLISSKNDLSDKLREMEEKFRGLQDLDRNVEQQNTNLQTHFTEARCNLDHLSEKLHNVTPDDELLVKLPTKEASKVKVESEKKVKEQEILANSNSKPEKMEEVEQGELHANPKPDKMEEVKKGELLEVSNPLKERETPAEASLVTELNGEKEEPENSDDPEKAVDEKAEQARQELDLHESDRDLTDNLSETLKNSELQNVSEKDHDHKSEEKIDKQVSSKILADHLNDEAEEEEPNWKQLFMNGMENREKVLLSEYTTVLRNFKDMKKRLTESDYKTGDQLFDTTLKLKELKNSNAKKDEQIRFLRNKLSILRAGMGDDEEFEKSTVAGSPRTEKDMTEDIPGMLMDQHDNISEIEQRFRESIDEVLEENLDFWLRFSTTLQQIQKFGTEVEDLQSELTKLEKKKKHEGSSTARFSLKSDVKPIYRHLREIHTELTLWIEKSMSLKDEVKSRFSSLCAIQEEITAALKDSAEDDDFRFTSYQAAKFRGEILNMKQENNKVADELQAGLDHITTLQLEIEQTLAKLNEEFKLAGSKNGQNIQLTHTESRSRVPLHSFIFGNKQKRQKPSFFACVHPVLHRKYHELRSGTSL